MKCIVFCLFILVALIGCNTKSDDAATVTQANVGADGGGGGAGY